MKEEYYDLSKDDLERLESGQEVAIITKDNHLIVLFVKETE